jgi:hypothetical protein
MAASGAFAEAYSTVENVEKLVEDRVKASTEVAKDLQASAMETVFALGHVDLNFNAGGLPAPPKIDPSIKVDLNLPHISPTSFGTITSELPSVPTLDPVPAIPDLNIPDFQSSISSLNIPNAPAWTTTLQLPTEPTIEDVVVPNMPAVTIPAAPTLTEITVPSFSGLTLPTFSATAPEFEGTALPGILQWSEPTYHTVILDDVVKQLRKLWDGGSGIPPAVEQAMWARATDREDLTTKRELDSVSEEFSMRGFTMPPGMQAARIDQLRQDLAVKKLGLNRELTIQIAQWQVENVRFACTQAIAAENVYVNLFLNQAQRLFDAARVQVESQINIYNAQVALFNARMNGYEISARVFNTLVQAELSKIEAFKAEVEAEVARGQINTQKVQAYAAMIDALKAQTEVYRTQMQGAEIKSNVLRDRIEVFKAKIQAYAEQINAQKVVFDAYESQVKGEAAKAGIIDAEARAYAALIQGKSTLADIDMKKAEVTIQKNKVLIEGYQAALEAEKARIQSQLSIIQSGAQAYIADTQRYAAVAQAEGAKAQVEVSAKEAELRTNVAFYQAQVQAYIGNMEQLIRKAALIVDALKAAGSISSTLAAGAMAGVHVGATLSGSGGVNATGAEQYTQSTSKSESFTKTDEHKESRNYNYDGGKP